MSVGLDESLQSLCELVNLLPPHVSTAAQWGCPLFPQHANMFTVWHANMLSLHRNHFLIHYLPYVPFLMFGIYFKIKSLITKRRNHHRKMWPKSQNARYWPHSHPGPFLLKQNSFLFLVYLKKMIRHFSWNQLWRAKRKMSGTPHIFGQPSSKDCKCQNTNIHRKSCHISWDVSAFNWQTTLTIFRALLQAFSVRSGEIRRLPLK